MTKKDIKKLFGLKIKDYRLKQSLTQWDLAELVDVDQKPRVKQRIIQTMIGIVGIILAISIVNLIIDLFGVFATNENPSLKTDKYLGNPFVSLLFGLETLTLITF